MVLLMSSYNAWQTCCFYLYAKSDEDVYSAEHPLNASELCPTGFISITWANGTCGSVYLHMFHQPTGAALGQMFCHQLDTDLIEPVPFKRSVL